MTHKPISLIKFPIEDATTRSTHAYLSEENQHELVFNNSRKLYAHVFDVAPLKIPKPIERLHILAVRDLVSNYRGGTLSDNLNTYDKALFGELLELDLDFEKLIDLDSNLVIYWKRLVQKFSSKNAVELRAMKRKGHISWKNIAIELKFSRMLETTSYEKWCIENLTDLAKKLSPFIKRLCINGLQSMDNRMLELNPYNKGCKIYNHLDRFYCHGDLSFISHLKNLHTFMINFGQKNLQYGYNRRYFEIASQDILNVSIGLGQIANLTSLQFSGNKMDFAKMNILIKGLFKNHLTRLDFSYCHLNAISIKPIAYFLSENCTLKYLELMGNNISGSEVNAFASGLERFRGVLKYLGFSRNQLGAKGAVALVTKLINARNVLEIDFSCCEVGCEGSREIVNLLSFQTSLKSLDISSIPLTRECAADLYQYLKDNYNMEILDCRCCNLTVEQEAQIRVLLERNIYYKTYPFLFKSSFTEDDEIEIDHNIGMNLRHWQFGNVSRELEALNNIIEMDNKIQI